MVHDHVNQNGITSLSNDCIHNSLVSLSLPMTSIAVVSQISPRFLLSRPTIQISFSLLLRTAGTTDWIVAETVVRMLGVVLTICTILRTSTGSHCISQMQTPLDQARTKNQNQKRHLLTITVPQNVSDSAAISLGKHGPQSQRNTNMSAWDFRPPFQRAYVASTPY